MLGRRGKLACPFEAPLLGAVVLGRFREYKGGLLHSALRNRSPKSPGNRAPSAGMSNRLRRTRHRTKKNGEHAGLQGRSRVQTLPTERPAPSYPELPCGVPKPQTAACRLHTLIPVPIVLKENSVSGDSTRSGSQHESKSPSQNEAVRGQSHNF